MRYRVVIQPRAERDVEEYARWWAAKHSIEQAVRWFDRIHEQLKSLSEFPEGNSLSVENDEFPYEIRDKLVGLGSRPNYRAIFTIQADVVFVLTLRRTSQDRITPDQLENPT
ncbi:MAG: type II toxin-antitoxin system RelE/ParE family toxin [Planctomycetota bacterium]|nr:type II toxin-antitoxin system RelE/ParE family toxin [Planctomycetota bacterium]MDA1211073.1 type II toxin-antitoxin system RelE/ParE family toxin [Planctomycetota bacterium]